MSCLHSESHQSSGSLQLILHFLSGPKTNSREIMLLFLFRLWIPCAFQILISVYFTSGSTLFFPILPSTVFTDWIMRHSWCCLFIPVGIFLTSDFFSLLHSASPTLTGIYPLFLFGPSGSLIYTQNTLWSERELTLQWSFLSMIPKRIYPPQTTNIGLCLLCVWQDPHLFISSRI